MKDAVLKYTGRISLVLAVLCFASSTPILIAIAVKLSHTGIENLPSQFNTALLWVAAVNTQAVYHAVVYVVTKHWRNSLRGNIDD